MKSLKNVRWNLIVAITLLLMGFVVAYSQATAYRLQASLAQLNITGSPANFTFTASVGDQTNQAYMTVSALDKNGNRIPGAVFDFWWSDFASCVNNNVLQGSITATASSGTSGLLVGTGAGTSAGTMYFVTAATPSVATSRIPFQVGGDFNGQVKIGVIDSAKTLYVPCIWAPFAGVKAGPPLVVGNYK